MLHFLALSLALSAQSTTIPTQKTDSVRADDAIRMVALRHAKDIQTCYENHGLKVNPTLTGTVEVEVTVLPSGRVRNANVSASALRGTGRENVESCITTAVKNWRYQRGNFAVETIVYPFSLVPDKGATTV
jgi:hypothetical protein